MMSLPAQSLIINVWVFARGVGPFLKHLISKKIVDFVESLINYDLNSIALFIHHGSFF